VSIYKRLLQLGAYGREIRVRRKRKRSSTVLTKGDLYWGPVWKDPHPDGYGWEKWLADTWGGYVGYKGARRRRACARIEKRKGRRSKLKKEARRAFREQEE
jgi:hypothetical protein